MSKYVHAQKLNRRVEIQRLSGARDDSGQPLDEWVRVCKVWADVKGVSGMGFVNQEFVTGGREVSRTTASVRIRMRAGIEPTMRCVIQGRTYEIRIVLPDTQDNRFLDLGVAIGGNDG